MMHAVEFQETFAWNALRLEVKLGQKLAKTQKTKCGELHKLQAWYMLTVFI